MRFDGRKIARGAGRFLTSRAEIASSRLNTINRRYDEINRASGGVLDLVLGATPIPQMVSTVYNPLVTTIEATHALGRGLSTLGKLDYNKFNSQNAGQGISDLKRAYDLGKRAIDGRGLY